MIIKAPAVYLTACTRIANLYINDYNTQIIDGKPRANGEKLKLVHKTVFANIIWEYLPYTLEILKEGNGKLNSTNLPRLETNNVILGKRVGVCKETVRRAKKRLKKAGMILEDIWKGSESDYLLILNPLLLAIYDEKNADFKPKLYRTEIENIKVSTATKCRPLSIHIKDTSNNKKTTNSDLIIRMCVPRFVKDTRKDTQNGNTPKQTKPTIPSIQNSIKKTDYEKEMHRAQSEVDKHKHKLATEIVELYMKIVLSIRGLTANFGNTKAAIEEIENNYFKTNNAVTINTLADKYKESIRLSARYAEKNPNYHPYFPAQHFNPENLKNGVRTAVKWVNENIQFKVNKATKKEIRVKEENLRKQKEESIKMGYVPAPEKKIQTQMTDYQKLEKAKAAYYQNPGSENYGLCLNYVYQHIPHMIGDFMNSIKTI